MFASTKDDGMPKDREYIRLVVDKISNDEREELLLVEEFLYVLDSILLHREVDIARKSIREILCAITDINE